MQKPRTKHSRRIRNLITISALTAIILSVSTYAWFIGMQSVGVTSFDVEIEATDSLLLSLDGKRWSPEITVSEDTLNSLSYDGHTNTWGDLIPMSTIGEMDVDASRMKLFEKASFTATPGGYRLMASRVDNNTDSTEVEPDGYVVFDLFIRNFSGTQYLSALNLDPVTGFPLDEEAIYLTTDSQVTVAALGEPNTGLENSVRVAFAQIGRVDGTELDDEVITGITCVPTGEGTHVPGIKDGVTGICRTAQIWEPNDKAHVEAAINWYNESCIARKASPDSPNITLASAYSGACGVVANGTAYSTYAIKAAIASTDNVDVYDGKDYNTYESTALLEAYSYFTDTMKNLKKTERPEFMYLAPNSVTKVRVYIYIEGQDIDNYDFSSIGKKIAVQFGFTKERFTDVDIDYEGPARDTTRPIITLTGDNTQTIAFGGPYVELGATAIDPVSVGNPTQVTLTSDIVIDSSGVKVNVAGTYYVTYNVEDSSGNHAALKSRTVIILPEEPED